MVFWCMRLTFVRRPRRFRHGAVAPERALRVRNRFLHLHVGEQRWGFNLHDSCVCACVRVREQISQVHPVTRRHRPETLSIFIRAPRLPRRVDGSEDAGSMRSAGRDVKTLGDTHWHRDDAEDKIDSRSGVFIDALANKVQRAIFICANSAWIQSRCLLWVKGCESQQGLAALERTVSVTQLATC